MESHQATPLAKNNSRIKKLQPLLFLFIFCSLFFLTNILFSIKNIECHSDGKSCSTETIEKISTLKHRSLFFTDFEPVSRQFSDVKIQKKLPNTLIIFLKEDKQEYFSLVGSEIQKVEYKNSDPEITSIANELINELDKAQIKWNKIEYINQVLIVYIESREAAYRALIDKQEISTGVYRIKTTLDHIDIKGQVDVSIKEIDARFKLPVLKTQFTNI